MSSVFRTIDKISDTVGNYFSYALPLMAVLMIIEVGARYLFNQPTSWIWPVDIQLMVLVFAFAGCYAMLNHTHVRVDIIYGRLSERGKVITDAATFIVPLFFLCILVWVSIDVGWVAFLRGESTLAGFEPPIWHLKLIIIPLGAILLLMQTVANLGRRLRLVFKRKQQ